MGEVWFVTGGARSGKSRFAESLAAGLGSPVVYVATMQPLDEELTQRITRHRSERPAAWATVEAPLDLARAVSEAPRAACVLVDCLSLWVSNRLLAEGEHVTLEVLEATLTEEVDALAQTAAERAAPTILDTNEVGDGVVPEYALGRAYRDLLGVVNQRASASASRAWLLVAGRALVLPSREQR
jgi:adenosylcobinamide kinase/adenosylcobinamide-phosphate guanylyltransferase